MQNTRCIRYHFVLFLVGRNMFNIYICASRWKCWSLNRWSEVAALSFPGGLAQRGNKFSEELLFLRIAHLLHLVEERKQRNVSETLRQWKTEGWAHSNDNKCFSLQAAAHAHIRLYTSELFSNAPLACRMVSDYLFLSCSSAKKQHPLCVCFFFFLKREQDSRAELMIRDFRGGDVTHHVSIQNAKNDAS